MRDLAQRGERASRNRLFVVLLDGPRFPEEGWAHLPDVVPWSDALLIRHKGATPQELWDFARRVQAVVPHASLWIDGPLEVALAVEATGWHLPAQHLPASTMRQGWKGLLSAAAHTADEARRHQAADVLVWGHAFWTRSKPGAPPRTTLGDVIHQVQQPVIAIGGITPETVSHLSGVGLGGVVAADGVWLAASPEEAARRIRGTIDRPEWAGAQQKEGLPWNLL